MIKPRKEESSCTQIAGPLEAVLQDEANRLKGRANKVPLEEQQDQASRIADLREALQMLHPDSK